MKFESDLNHTREMPAIDMDAFKEVSGKMSPLPGEDTDRFSAMPESELNRAPKVSDFYVRQDAAVSDGEDAAPGVGKAPSADGGAEAEAAAAPFSDDDFVIGRGFKIEDKGENITLNTGERRIPERKTTAAPPPGGRSRRRKKKKSGCLGAFAWIIITLGISVGLAVAAIFGASDVFGIGKSGLSEVNIPEGSSTVEIAESLKDAGAIRFPMLFRLYSKVKHTDGTYQYGLYSINNEGGYDGIIDQLQKEGAKADTTELRIAEMSTVKKIAAALEENGVCTASDFSSVMRSVTFDYDFVKEIPTEMVAVRLEGYLAPDTYEFYVTDDSKTGAELAIRRMLDRTAEIWTSDRRAKAETMGYSIHEIMTMASIIELEAGGSSQTDMQNVAAVFYNRLSWNDRKLLGSSPTAAYAQLYGNDRYDTNKTEGLPPGPLCAPSEAAIEAALNPTPDFAYYYFVTDASATFHYSKTLAEHNSTISRLQNSGNWLGDGDMTQMFQ
ncbi:MAG: endolytic transglycosylase MltG [Candidatus Howiella sp.]|jgi:UPF0755 protein